MHDELAVRARIQTAISLATLDVSIVSKTIDMTGISLETANELAVGTHLLRILQAVAFDALPDGSWVTALKTSRDYYRAAVTGDFNERKAIHKFLSATHDLVD